MKIEGGSSRTVWVFKNYVVKFPTMRYSFENFIRGLLANITEGRVWECCSEESRHLLCPVSWYAWTGFILIMKRARLCSDDDKIDYDRYEGFGDDHKSDNYGWLKGQIVKIDYQNK